MMKAYEVTGFNFRKEVKNYKAIVWAMSQIEAENKGIEKIKDRYGINAYETDMVTIKMIAKGL